MKPVISLFAILAVALIGCGKTDQNRVEPKVEAKKDAPAPKVDPKKDAPKVDPKVEPKKDAPKKAVSLDGTYKSGCEKGKVTTVTIKGDSYEEKVVTFKEKDCTGTSEVKTTNAKISVTETTEEGFTHVIDFDDTYSLRVSLAAKSLKFEGESAIYSRK